MGGESMCEARMAIHILTTTPRGRLSSHLVRNDVSPLVVPSRPCSGTSPRPTAPKSFDASPFLLFGLITFFERKTSLRAVTSLFFPGSFLLVFGEDWLRGM